MGPFLAVGPVGDCPVCLPGCGRPVCNPLWGSSQTLAVLESPQSLLLTLIGKHAHAAASQNQHHALARPPLPKARVYILKTVVCPRYGSITSQSRAVLYVAQL